MVRYANGSSAREATLKVNATDITTGAFNSTGEWTNWVEQTFNTVPLVAGTNVIRLTATTAEGLPNIDRFEVEWE